MQQSCKWCGRMHPIGFACPMKPQKHRKNTKAQRFRNTAEWRHTRTAVNKRDLYLCRLCLRDGRLNTFELSTHHIIPLEEDMQYATVEDWCITLCEAHHRAAEAGEYDKDELHQLAMKVPLLP